MTQSLPHLFDTSKYRESLQWYSDNLAIREDEKNSNGEVFTPHSLVCEMLDSFPDDVWTNPNFRWLDPSAGYGQFMFEVVHRLMKGLRRAIPNHTKRLRHIVEHMIYQIEFNEDSYTLLRKLFSSNGTLKPNILHCSFVDGDSYTRVFGKGNFTFKDGTKQFDCIIGNPPFNTPKRDDVIGGTFNSLWPKFVDRAILLQTNRPKGIIGFIHTPDWRSYSGSHSKLTSLLSHTYGLVYLHMYSSQLVKDLFDVAIKVDLYVVRKGYRASPKVVDIKQTRHTIQPVHTPPYCYFIPSVISPVISRMIGGPDSNSANYLYDSSSFHGSYIKKKPDKLKPEPQKPDYIHEVVHTIAKKKPKIYYTNTRKTGFFGVPKVIFYTMGNHSMLRPIIDLEGKYGMSQLVFGNKIPRKFGSRKLLSFFQSKSYQTFVEGIHIGRDVDKGIFTLLKPNWYSKRRSRSRSRKQLYSKRRSKVVKRGPLPSLHRPPVDTS